MNLIEREQFERYLAATVEAFGVTAGQVLGRTRLGPVAEARQCLYYALKRAGWSAVTIGRALDRDHTAVDHGCYKVERRMESAGYRALVEYVINAPSGEHRGEVGEQAPVLTRGRVEGRTA